MTPEAKNPRNGLRLSLGGLVSGTTLVAAITAAAGWLTTQGRIAAQIDGQDAMISRSDARAEKLTSTITDLAVALSSFTAASSTDRAALHQRLDAINERLRDLERPQTP